MGINWNNTPHLAVWSMSLPASFQWPWQYGFPPFFTVQPNTDTRSKQLDAWCNLVLSYHRATKSYLLDVNEAQSSPLFYNSKINSILLFYTCLYLNIPFAFSNLLLGAHLQLLFLRAKALLEVWGIRYLSRLVKSTLDVIAEHCK